MKRASVSVDLLLLAATLAAAAPARAAEDCPAPASPPAELSGWTHPMPLAAGTDAARAAPLLLGAAGRAALAPLAKVRFAHAPERQDANGYGGLFALHIRQPGRYRIALGAAGWIDVVQDGQPVPSRAHAHGPACTGIRKMVDFDLAPGDYLVQIEGAVDRETTVLAARLL